LIIVPLECLIHDYHSRFRLPGANLLCKATTRSDRERFMNCFNDLIKSQLAVNIIRRSPSIAMWHYSLPLIIRLQVLASMGIIPIQVQTF